MEITNCRACDSDKLTEFMNFGDQYLSDFREDDKKPPKYPLVVVLCEDCKLVQLKHSTPQAEMYHENYGFKSGINEKIKDDLQDNVRHAQDFIPKPTRWLDVASNDGSLLSFVPKDVYRVGVDPISFLCKEAEQHADLIINDYYSLEAVRWLELFDVITSISCFYDMPDPRKFVSDVAVKLSKKGVWIIQQNYLLTTMQLSAIDNFCHEHLEYYTLLSLEKLLEKCGLEVNDVVITTVNGGSIRTVVSHKGTFPIDVSVELQREREKEYNLDKIETYRDFASKANLQLLKLKTIVEAIKQEGKSICILAASTRGATIWQAAGFGPEQIEYAVERNPAKVGKMFSAIGVPIVSEDEFLEDQPDYAIIGPWFFGDAFIDRYKNYTDNGGYLIMPLPEVEVL